MAPTIDVNPAAALCSFAVDGVSLSFTEDGLLSLVNHRKSNDAERRQSGNGLINEDPDAASRDTPPSRAVRRSSEKSFNGDHGKNDRAPAILSSAVSLGSEGTIVAEPVKTKAAGKKASFVQKKSSKRTVRKIVQRDDTVVKSDCNDSVMPSICEDSTVEGAPLLKTDLASGKTDGPPLPVERKLSERSFDGMNAKNAVRRIVSVDTTVITEGTGSVIASVSEEGLTGDAVSTKEMGRFLTEAEGGKDAPPSLLERQEEAVQAGQRAAMDSNRLLKMLAKAKDKAPNLVERKESEHSKQALTKDQPPAPVDRVDSERPERSVTLIADRPPVPVDRIESGRSERTFNVKHATKDRPPAPVGRAESQRVERTPVEKDQATALEHYVITTGAIDAEIDDDITVMSTEQSQKLSRHQKRLNSHRIFETGYVSDFLKDPKQPPRPERLTQSDHGTSRPSNLLWEESSHGSIASFGGEDSDESGGTSESRSISSATRKKVPKNAPNALANFRNSFRVKKGEKHKDLLVAQSDHGPTISAFYDSTALDIDTSDFAEDEDSEEDVLSEACGASGEDRANFDCQASFSVLELFAQEDEDESKKAQLVLNESRRVMMLMAQRNTKKGDFGHKSVILKDETTKPTAECIRLSQSTPCLGKNMKDDNATSGNAKKDFMKAVEKLKVSTQRSSKPSRRQTRTSEGTGSQPRRSVKKTIKKQRSRSLEGTRRPQRKSGRALQRRSSVGESECPQRKKRSSKTIRKQRSRSLEAPRPRRETEKSIRKQRSRSLEGMRRPQRKSGKALEKRASLGGDRSLGSLEARRRKALEKRPSPVGNRSVGSLEARRSRRKTGKSIRKQRSRSLEGTRRPRGSGRRLQRISSLGVSEHPTTQQQKKNAGKNRSSALPPIDTKLEQTINKMLESSEHEHCSPKSRSELPHNSLQEFDLSFMRSNNS